MEINGKVMQYPKMIDNHILGYYESFFLAQVGDAMDFILIESILPYLVTSIDNDNLRSIPLKEAIRAIIFEIDL